MLGARDVRDAFQAKAKELGLATNLCDSGPELVQVSIYPYPIYIEMLSILYYSLCTDSNDGSITFGNYSCLCANSRLTYIMKFNQKFLNYLVYVCMCRRTVGS